MDIVEIVLCIGVFGVWVYNYFIGKTVKNLKSMTDSTKNIFDAMKTSSDYMSNVHKTAQTLYDPAEIEKVVKLRVELCQEEYKKTLINKLQILKENMTSSFIDIEKKRLKGEEITEKVLEYNDKALNLCDKFEKFSKEQLENYKNDVGALSVFVSFATSVLTDEQMNMFLSNKNNQHLMKECKILFAAIGKKISEK